METLMFTGEFHSPAQLLSTPSQHLDHHTWEWPTIAASLLSSLVSGSASTIITGNTGKPWHQAHQVYSSHLSPLPSSRTATVPRPPPLPSLTILTGFADNPSQLFLPPTLPLSWVTVVYSHYHTHQQQCQWTPLGSWLLPGCCSFQSIATAIAGVIKAPYHWQRQSLEEMEEVCFLSIHTQTIFNFWGGGGLSPTMYF